MIERMKAAALHTTAAVVLAGCHDPGAPSAGPQAVRLILQVARIPGGDTLAVFPFYRRVDQTIVPLDSLAIELDHAAASQSIPLEIDITTCLSDPAREGGGAACPLRLRLMLRNNRGEVLDSIEAGPLTASAGTSQPVTFSPGGVKVIDAAGGTVATPDGKATLIIPPGALTSPTTLGIRAQQQHPADTRLAPGTVYGLTPSGLTFAQPATLTLKYDPATVPGGSYRAVGLRAAAVNVEGRWARHSWNQPDLQSATLTVPITHFSTYGLIIATDMVSAGYWATCRVTTALQGACWGDNQFQQLGDGTADYHFTAAPVAGAQGFVQVALGWQHGCGLAAAGLAYCWGQNFRGELGIGNQPSALPQPVLGGLSFVKLGVGYNTGPFCGLTAAGAIYCWGFNGNGGVGTGSTSPQIVTQPVAVTGGHVFTDLSVGFGTACGITDAADLWCWGWGIAGQLGNGSTTQTAVPTPTLVSGGLKWLAISAGVAHACGLTTAGKAYCWGQNAAGELGDPALPISGPPTFSGSAVPNAVVGGRTFQTISAGNTFSCGVEPSGQTDCWGNNLFGGLGDGSSDSSRATPGPVSLPGPIVSLSSGVTHACAETVAGALYCWGDNHYGGLGTGTSAVHFSPAPLLGNLSFSSLGDGRPGCGLIGGSAYCWGANHGNGSPGGNGPSKVNGGPYAAIANGAGSVCAVDSGGAFLCWGANNNGEFGDGTKVASTLPVPGGSGQTFRQVSVALEHACGVTTVGATVCWGANNNGQLGDGTTTPKTVPTAVVGSQQFIDVVTGPFTSCGLAQAKDAYCWGGSGAKTPTLIGGGHQFSQLSTGNRLACGVELGTSQTFCWGVTATGFTLPLPSAMPGGQPFVELATGEAHTCGRTSAGQVYCWGSRVGGAIGDGSLSTLRADQPSLVPGLTAVAIRAGYASSCALTPSGSVFCWGDDWLFSFLGVDTPQRFSNVPVLAH